jgi:PAS domain S-box-containing protein
MNIRDLRDPSTQEVVARQMAQADEESGRRGIRFETLHRRQDGSVFPVEVSSIGADVGHERLLMSVIRDISDRKAAEAALAASEAKFATAFSLSPLILAITNLADGRLIEVNESFVRTTGYTRAEALGKTPDALGLWADPQQRRVGLARLAAGETVEDVEALFRMKNGELRTCLLGATIVEINGQPCALTALTDITERKAAEAALQASEMQLRMVTDNISGLISYVDSAERFRFINAAQERWFALAREQMIDRPVREVIDAGAYAHLAPYMARALAGERVSFENTRLYPDGVARTVMITYVPDINVDDEVLGFYALVTDITERKQAEEELRYQAYLLENVQDAIISIDLDFTIRTWNRGAEQIYGWSAQEAVGRSVRALLSTVYLEETINPQAVFDTLLAEGHWQGQVIHHHRDGARLFISNTTTILRDEAGNAVGAVAVNRDITSQKEAEQALRASESQLTLITDNVSGLISYVDHSERYRFVNAVYEAWFATPRAAIIGQTIREQLGETAYAHVQPHVQRALAGERTTFENTIAYRDGVTRTVLATYVPDIDIDGAVRGFYALITDITDRKQAEERLRFLAEASSLLASSLDINVTLENVAHSAVPGIADWCAVDLVGDDGAIEGVALAHVDPTKVRWAEELRARYPIDPNAPVGAPNVIRTGRSEFYPEITDAMLAAVAKNEAELQLLRSVGYRSVIIAPLETHGTTIGAITFVLTESERRFTESDPGYGRRVGPPRGRRDWQRPALSHRSTPGTGSAHQRRALPQRL